MKPNIKIFGGMKMVFVLFLLTALSSNSVAQIREKLSPEDRQFYDFIAKNPSRLYCTMCRYEMKDTVDTPAPEGYKAFYISHYGRHGSRYTYHPKVFRNLDEIRKMKADGLLSEKGETLLNAYELLYSRMEGNWGELTRLGADEHYGIGDRMAKRFPEIWESQGRVINVYATEFKRVRESRDNFMLGFNKVCPTFQNFNLEVDTPTAKLATRGYYKPSDQKTGRYADSVLNSSNKTLKKILCNDKELAGLFFKKGSNPSEKQIQMFRKNFSLLFQREALGESNIPYCDTLVPFGELLYIAAKDANHWCQRHALTLDNEGVGVKYQGLGIMRNFFDEAEEAISFGKLSATFRFGHDSYLLTLICALDLDEYDQNLTCQESFRNNYLANIICLASNIQMVFYKKEGGDVLVKILHNEEETLVRNLKPFCGPYYKWSDLKAYLSDRETRILARPAIMQKVQNS